LAEIKNISRKQQGQINFDIMQIMFVRSLKDIAHFESLFFWSILEKIMVSYPNFLHFYFSSNFNIYAVSCKVIILMGY
jgi:hypothetical protein